MFTPVADKRCAEGCWLLWKNFLRNIPPNTSTKVISNFEFSMANKETIVCSQMVTLYGVFSEGMV